MEDVIVDIGSQLKGQREKLGFSLEEAAQHTRIRKTYLESIENDKFSDLPGYAYVTGFVKSYAVYLGVDTAPLLAQLAELRLSDGPPSLKPVGSVKYQSKGFSQSPSGVGWRIFALGLFGVLFLGGAAYFITMLFQDKVTADVDSGLVVIERQPLPEPELKHAEAALESVVASSEAEQVAPLLVEPNSVVEAPDLPALKPLPFVPDGGSSLRMLALSGGSLIIYVDDRRSRQYQLHDGLDLTWNIKKMVKVELAEPGMARFWLGEQELDLGETGSFQLQTETGDE